MSKFVVLGDIHLGLYNDSENWHKVVLDLFKDIHDTCHRQSIEYVIILGDFFHNRKSTNTKTQHVAYEIADIMSRFRMIMLVGNHDAYYKNKNQPTSLRIFKDYKKIQIIDKSMLISDPDNILLVPWKGEILTTHYKYCMGHFEINGFHMNDSYICKRGQIMSDFSDFDIVLSSHFHTPSTQGKITHLGSPYQQTFHDAGSTRGYYIFEDGNLDLVEFKKYPHFVKMSTEKIRPMKIGGNIIKLTFDKDYGTAENEKIIDKVMSKNPYQIHVDFSKISYEVDDEPDEELPDMIDHDKIIVDYVSKIDKPENIKTKTLMDIMFKLTEEIRDV